MLMCFAIQKVCNVCRKAPEEGEKQKDGPFFLFIYVDDKICVARGRGGGLAMWLGPHQLMSLCLLSCCLFALVLCVLSQYQRPCRLKTLHIQAGIIFYCKCSFCWYCCCLLFAQSCFQSDVALLCFAQGPDIPCLGSKGRPYSGLMEKSPHAFQTDKSVYTILTFSALSSHVCEPTNLHATAIRPQQQMVPIFMRLVDARRILPCQNV